MNKRPLRWPDGRAFALSIIDDTDQARTSIIAPFYDALRRYGLRTTKTIWPLPTPADDRFWSESLDDDAYRRWLHALRADGFEIASHGARSGGSQRAVTLAALERFRHEFGEYPATYANHAQNSECIYWGPARFDLAPFRLLYGTLRQAAPFAGERPHSEFFWGDACRERIKFVRNFTFKDIVTSACDPFMPYHDPRRPFVRAWFSASEGADVEAFVALLSAQNVDRLERSGGASIVYTHVASGFVRDGRLDPRVDAALAGLAARNGWFVGVQTLLGHVERERGLPHITRAQHAALEMRWARDHARGALRSLRRRAPLARNLLPKALRAS